MKLYSAISSKLKLNFTEVEEAIVLDEDEGVRGRLQGGEMNDENQEIT